MGHPLREQTVGDNRWMNDSARARPFRRVNPSDARGYDELLYPTFNADGNLKYYPADGDDVEIFDVDVSRHYFSKFTSGLSLTHSLKSVEPEKRSEEVYNCVLAVTDARLILMSTVHRWSDDRNVSHVWYPWISGITYRPKQSFLLDAVLNVSFRQDFPLVDRGMWWHRIEFGLGKGVDSGELARTVVSRIARHHLRHGVHDSARAEVAALVEPRKLAAPDKGSTATYILPAFVAFPGGVPHVGSGTEIAWQWNGPNIDEPEDQEEDNGFSDAPVFEPAPSPDLGSTSADDERAPTRDVGSETPPVQALSPGEQRIIRSQLSAARGLHRLRRYEDAAEIHEAVLDHVGWVGRNLSQHRFDDVVMRLAEELLVLDDPDASLPTFETALRSEGVRANEELELLIREKLCELLRERRELPLYAENLRRMGALSGAWCTRAEQVGIRIQLAAMLREEKSDEEALMEYDRLAELYRSLEMPASESAALQWSAHLLARLDRLREAADRWRQGQECRTGPDLRRGVVPLHPPVGRTGRQAG